MILRVSGKDQSVKVIDPDGKVIAWNKGDLTGAAVSSSNGHLSVVVGFDANGNPIVNDPAAATNDEVQRPYDRTEFESLWLEHSGGTTYLIYPAGTTVPTTIP